jgi:hypothetical protein
MKNNHALNTNARIDASLPEALELLAMLSRQGVRVSIEGDRLQVRAAHGAARAARLAKVESARRGMRVHALRRVHDGLC